jgi:thiamine-phosphate pyrophosphorylase
MHLPRLYPIIDLAAFAGARDPVLAVSRFAEELLQGGSPVIQYRDKSADLRRFLTCARELRRITRDKATFIINDRLDLCIAAGADGVHLGQDDLSPQAARKVLDSARSYPFALASNSRGEISCESARHPSLVIGFSTHNLAQVREADTYPVDYIAVGPVFTTASKANPDPLIGLDGVATARAATNKPLVAIGGITRQNCRQVVEAGADSVAVIADLLDSPVKALEEFLRILG